jgi:Holliday junction resolvase RusA-like endonuclease
MSEPIYIEVAGEAAPFRKKTMSWQAKDGRFGTHAYDDKKYAGWKDAARYAAGKAMEGRPPLDCAVSFHLKVYFQIAESASNKQRERMIAGTIRPCRVPDADNLMKAAGDAMTGIVIRDDKFIVHAIIEKWYSDRPRVEITVEPIEMKTAPVQDAAATASLFPQS